MRSQISFGKNGKGPKDGESDKESVHTSNFVKNPTEINNEIQTKQGGSPQ